MLDPRMAHSCGYWRRAATLAQAQENSSNWCAASCGSEPGMRVLDIGCGWGSFMGYAAGTPRRALHRRHRVGRQAAYAETTLRGSPAANSACRTTANCRRTRSAARSSAWSASACSNTSAGATTASSCACCARCLADDGLALLHTIGKRRRDTTIDPWIDKYVFPNGDLPSMGQIGDAIDDVLVAEGRASAPTTTAR